MIDIPVIVLAAGASTRFGDDKLLATVCGQPLLAWTLEVAIDSVPIDHVLVIVDDPRGARAELCEQAGVATLVAPDATRGMRWSMHEGLTGCPPGVPGAVIILADDPLAARALPGVLATARRTPTRPAAVRRDPFVPHPVYLPRAIWPARPSSDEDHGLRDLLMDDDCTWIDDPGVAPVDVDTPADVDRLVEALSASGA